MRNGIQTAIQLTIICLIVISASISGRSQSPISEEKKKRLGDFDPVDIFSPVRTEGRKVREKRTQFSEAAAIQAPVRRTQAPLKNQVAPVPGNIERPTLNANTAPVSLATPSPEAQTEPRSSPSPSLSALAVTNSTIPAAAPETQPSLSRASLESASGAFTVARERDRSSNALRKFSLPVTLVLLLGASVTLVLMVLKLLRLRSQDS